MNLLVAAQPVVLVSIAKPIIFMLVLMAWGRWATFLDKDADYFFLPRRMLNVVQIVAAVVAFGLWLLIPFFWIGLPLAVAILGGAGIAYVSFRNNKVPDTERWTFSTDFITQVVLQRRIDSATREARLRFVGGSKSARDFKPVPLPEQPHYRAHMVLEELLEAAFEREAQRIDLVVAGQQATAKLLVDGVGYTHQAPAPGEALAMLKYLKGECGMDAEDMRRKQTGECRVDVAELGQHELRISTAGSTRGVTCSIEIDVAKQLGRSLDQLGLLEKQMEQLKPVLASDEGTVIVATPPDQGRTTTLYALLNQHDPYMQDIHTIEPEPDLDLEGVSQHEPGETTMTKALNSLLLRDPQIVMISQIAEIDMPPAIAKASVDGKRLYVGLKADDTFSALRTWSKALGDADLTARSVSAIISQRLIRTLCPQCRQAYQPEPAALKKLNLPADRVEQMYKATGKITEDNKTVMCPTCHGFGYHGQTGVFEVMVLDDAARQFLRQGQLDQMRSHLRKNRMLMLQEAALSKAVGGVTSISEVMRVMGGPSSQKNDASGSRAGM